MAIIRATTHRYLVTEDEFLRPPKEAEQFFQKAVSGAIGRPVFTHEFGSALLPLLKKELFGDREPPTFEELMVAMSKSIIVCLPNEK